MFEFSIKLKPWEELDDNGALKSCHDNSNDCCPNCNPNSNGEKLDTWGQFYQQILASKSKNYLCSMLSVTQILPPSDFLCKIGDFEMAQFFVYKMKFADVFL